MDYVTVYTVCAWWNIPSLKPYFFSYVAFEKQQNEYVLITVARWPKIMQTKKVPKKSSAWVDLKCCLPVSSIFKGSFDQNSIF